MQGTSLADHIRKAVRSYLERTGLSERQLAIAAGISQSTLNRFMSGLTHDLTMGTIALLADEMEVHVSVLLDEAPFAYSSAHTVTVLKAMEGLSAEKQQLLADLASSLATPS